MLLPSGQVYPVEETNQMPRKTNKQMYINSLGEGCIYYFFVLFCFVDFFFLAHFFQRESGQDICNFVQRLRLLLLLIFNYSEKFLLQNLSKKPGVVGSNFRV